MEYVHEVNKEFKENLKQMLCSPDINTINLAIQILNHVDLSNEETHKYITELILDTNCGLCVSFQDEDGFFIIETPNNITDFNKNNFYFYSSNVLTRILTNIKI